MEAVNNDTEVQLCVPELKPQWSEFTPDQSQWVSNFYLRDSLHSRS